MNCLPDMRKWILFFLFAFGIHMLATAQAANDFFTESISTNKTGMYVLGGWAIANIAAGSYGWASLSGSQKHFWQMNAAWNLVNLGIAGYAFYSFGQTDLSVASEAELWDSHNKTKRLYLINAGLDVLYMGAGAYLIHLSSKRTEKHALYKGFGQGIILQGGFLFVFDLTMYLIQQRVERIHHILPDQFALLPDGFTLVWRF